LSRDSGLARTVWFTREETGNSNRAPIGELKEGKPEKRVLDSDPDSQSNFASSNAKEGKLFRVVETNSEREVQTVLGRGHKEDGRDKSKRKL